MAFSSSNSNSPETATYFDVFLSFGGEDTRNGFASYLNYALNLKGYNVFFDDKSVHRGNAIPKELLKAIEDSRTSIVVLSENFASSSWCLTELAKIVECMESKKLTVLPIFYHVDPSVIRNQSESYWDALKKNENDPTLNLTQVNSWREALRQVTNIAGWHLNKSDVEVKFLQKFVADISSTLESKKSEDKGPHVFGKAITDSTLQGMPEYMCKKITATDRSHVALKMIDADNKLVNAQAFLNNLKSRYDNSISTLCLIYNATGGTLEHVSSINWFGHMVGESPYPDKIENGQWVSFLHVHDYTGASGSVAATVYRGKNANGTLCEWMLSWYISGDNNRVYTEIRENAHYERDYWKYIYNLLKKEGLNCIDSWGGCVSSVRTAGDSTSPIFQGVMKLLNA